MATGPTQPSAANAPGIEDLSQRALPLVADIAARAAQCEAECRVPEESVAAFKATGLHKTMLPARYGGYELSFAPMIETSYAIGQACASSAWVFGLYMVHNWLGALFPKAEIVTIDNAGHWVHAERPNAFVGAVEPFLVTGPG